MNKRKFFAIVLILAISSSLLLAGCGLIESTQDKTNAALDGAIRKLEQDSSSWRVVLQELESKLTKSAQSTIRTEVNNTLLRAEAAAGTQIKCIIDFIGDRVLEDLKKVRAGLTGEQVVREPKSCQVVPPAVDMSLEPSRRNLITLDGYNFDTMNGIQVFLVNTSNLKIDVSEKLKIPTHYQMTLNLGSNGVPLGADSDFLILSSGQKTISTISIIQPDVPACQVKTESFSPGPRTFIPPHTNGDKEFFGDVKINVEVTIRIETSKVFGHLHMKAEQPKDDHTTAEGDDDWLFNYVVPQGWELSKILTPTQDTYEYEDKDWEDDTVSRGGLIDRYEFVGDTNTDEAGTKTKVTMYFGTIQVQIVQTSNCAP